MTGVQTCALPIWVLFMRESIIDISLGLQVYDVGNEENEDASVDKVHKKILERILKVTEFEETYYNLFKNNLSKLSK